MSGYHNNFSDDFCSHREQGSMTGLVLKVAAGIILRLGVLLLAVLANCAWLIPEKHIGWQENRLLLTDTTTGAVWTLLDVGDKRRPQRAQASADQTQPLATIRLAQQLETTAKQKKDAAFKQFYQNPERCQVPASQLIKIECANEYVRAHREFDGIYQGG